jgi:hypothetical protein
MKLEKEVRGLLCFFILVLLFVNLISIAHAQAEDSTLSTIEKGWNDFTASVSQKLNDTRIFAINKLGWLIGTKNLEGDRVIFHFSFKYILMFLFGGALGFLLLRITFNFLSSKNITTPFAPLKKWYNYLIGMAMGFGLYMIFMGDVLSITFYFFSCVIFGAALIFWYALFEVFFIKFIIKQWGMPASTIWQEQKWRYLAVITFSFIYPFLMQVPILNNILSVITLEPLFFFSEHSLWGSIIRSFIVASALYFIPYMFKSLRDYITRREKYKKYLEKAAGEEILKIRVRRG